MPNRRITISLSEITMVGDKCGLFQQFIHDGHALHWILSYRRLRGERDRMVEPVRRGDYDAVEFFAREHLAPIGVDARDGESGGNRLRVRGVASAQRGNLHVAARREPGKVKALAPETRADHREAKSFGHLRPRANPPTTRSEKMTAISCGVRRPSGEYHW